MSPARRKLVVLAGLVVVMGAGGAFWLTIEVPPPEPEVADAEEADPSREETEDLMRKIGYVQ